MQKGLITFSKHNVNGFVEEGFCNWKKALEKLEEHDRSERHKEAVLKQAAFSSTANVGAQLNAEHLKAQSHHQNMLLSLFQVFAFWLARVCHYEGILKILIHWMVIRISSFYCVQRTALS